MYGLGKMKHTRREKTGKKIRGRNFEFKDIHRKAWLLKESHTKW